MSSSFNIATLNCRGLNKLEKVLYVADMLKVNEIDLCFLQETHLDKDQGLKTLENSLMQYEVFSGLTLSKS